MWLFTCEETTEKFYQLCIKMSAVFKIGRNLFDFDSYLLNDNYANISRQLLVTLNHD